MIEAVENHMPETVIVVSTVDLFCSPGTVRVTFSFTEHLLACTQICVVDAPLDSRIICRTR